jgi:hypothetical protein
MADDYIEVTGMGEMWDFKSLGAGAELEGLYMGKEENVGPNGSTVHFIEVNGGQLGVWGNAILDTRLKNLKPDGVEMVKIVYKGKVKSEKTKGREYHDFQVFHKPYKPEYASVSNEVSNDDLADFEKSLGLDK